MGKLINDAIRFAVEKHAAQTRKMNDTPYILHPMEVAEIIGTMTNDEEIMAAGMLHDTIEDSGASADEIREKFGDRVAALVLAETENKRPGQSEAETWKIRKEESLAELKATTDPGVKILWLADKLSNVRSFVREYADEGPQIWEHLNQKDPAQQEWYYRSIREACRELEDTEAYREYTQKLEILFGGKTE